MNNTIIEIQNQLKRQMDRLDDNNIMEDRGASEISRANALSNTADRFLKAVNIQLSIINTAVRTEVTTEALQTQLGLTQDETQAE